MSLLGLFLNLLVIFLGVGISTGHWSLASAAVCASYLLIPYPPTRGQPAHERPMRLLLDPRIFNFVIMALYSLNIVRWAIAGRPADALYWLSALGITATVTFGYKH